MSSKLFISEGNIGSVKVDVFTAIGAAVGTYMGASTLLTAAAMALLGTTALPLIATIGIAAGAVLLASGAASAVGTLLNTGSFMQASKAGINGIVNPLPFVSVYLSGMGKSVDPPWFNILGIPEYIKAYGNEAVPTAPVLAPLPPMSDASAVIKSAGEQDANGDRSFEPKGDPMERPLTTAARTSGDYTAIQLPAKVTPELPAKPLTVADAAEPTTTTAAEAAQVVGASSACFKTGKRIASSQFHCHNLSHVDLGP